MMNSPSTLPSMPLLDADIDLLISCSISHYDGPQGFTFEPSTSLNLRRHFGFDQAFTLDISNACAGVFTGIAVAEAFLKAGLIQRAMIVSGEYITHLTATAQKELKGFLDPRLACLTLGDAGVAVILEQGTNRMAGLHEIELFTLGAYSRACIGRISEKPGGGAIMITDVVKLSSAAVEEATKHAVLVQKRGGWPPEGLNHLIMHQTSERTIKEGTDRVNEIYGWTVCSKENVVTNVNVRGNTATASHFLAFYDHVMKGNIRSGDNVVFSINGSGLTIGTAIYICDDLPDRIRENAAHPTAPKPSVTRPQKQTNSLNLSPLLCIDSVGLIPQNHPVRKETIHLAYAAAEACLEHSKFDRLDIELIIYTGTYRTEFLSEPSVSAMLAGDMEINHDIDRKIDHNTLCFDVLAGAIGFLAASQIVSGIMLAGQVQNAMIVAAEIENNAHIVDADKVGIEETASALTFQRTSGKAGLAAIHFRYFVEYLDSFTACCDMKTAGGRLYVSKAPELEGLMLDCAVTTVMAYFTELGDKCPKIDLVIPPQISSHFIHNFAQRIDCNAKVIDITCGKMNLYSSSTPLAFAHILQHGLAKSGDVGLIVEVGAGISVACALYFF
jgi:3-oxoacyl-[acyl-carrier-protein] synthase III